MNSEFRMTRRVQFAETDLAGVLHFANYFRYMEEIEHAFWRSLGMSVIVPDSERSISWPRVAVHCSYRAPAHFEDELELVLQLTKLGRRSLEFEVDFFRGSERLAECRYTTVCCEMCDGAFTTITVPDEIRRVLEPCVTSSGK